jgi:hypothetical protein
MHQALGQGQGAISDVDGQDQLAHGVHCDPNPMRRTRQALERLGLGDLTLFDGTEQGEQLIHLHLLDVEIV